MQKPVRGPKKKIATPKSGARAQVKSLRQNVENDVAELKKKIQEIQQQSLKAMQESINSVFKTQSAENLQLLARQDLSTRQQLMKAIKDAEKQNTDAANQEDRAEQWENIEDAGLQENYDAGESAMESARQSVEQAMNFARKSVEDAEKAISNLGSHKIPSV